jgi:hypothetical protein
MSLELHMLTGRSNGSACARCVIAHLFFLRNIDLNFCYLLLAHPDLSCFHLGIRLTACTGIQTDLWQLKKKGKFEKFGSRKYEPITYLKISAVLSIQNSYIGNEYYIVKQKLLGMLDERGYC